MQLQAIQGARSNLIFSETIPAQDREKLFGRILQDGIRERAGEYLYSSPDDFSDCEPYTLSPAEEETLTWLLETAGNKLAEIGFDNPEDLLPNREQIVIKEQPYLHEEALSDCDKFGQFITIALPYGITFHYCKARRAFFRAIAQFVYTRIITRSTPDDYPKYLVERGYRRQAIGFDEVNEDGELQGIFSNPLADLFALACMSKERYGNYVEIIVPYAEDELSFLIAMLITYAAKTGQPPLAVFGQVFKAHASRDFSLLEKLVTVLSAETIAIIYHLNQGCGPYTPGRKRLENAAERGGFLKTYLRLRKNIYHDCVLPFPGIKGGFRRRTEWLA